MIEGVMKLLVPHHPIGYEKVRVGPVTDGGYVMVDDFDHVRVAISGGVGHDDRWEQAIVEKGIKVEAWDVNPPSDPRMPFNLYVAPMEGYAYCNNSTLDAALSGYDTHEAIAKIDIEGGEWDLLRYTSNNTLNKIRHMVLEFHFLGDMGNILGKGLPVFQKLHETFRVIHVHGNNWSPTYTYKEQIIPDVIEITFANKNFYTLIPSAETFPTQLDCACNAEKDDIVLGTFVL